MKIKQKKIIIFSTIDSFISIPLVNHIVKQNRYSHYKFDILLMRSSFIRKIKVLIVMLLYGSIIHLLKRIGKGKNVKDLKKFKNVNILKKFTNKRYDYGLSVYYTKKIKIQKYKIYNFHLGSLFNQRGSFIFFYKFIYKWKSIDLTFHEIQDKFDVGKIINRRKIKNLNKMNALKVMTLYLDNLNFLIQSVDKVGKNNKGDKLKVIKKLHTVPSFNKIFSRFINK